MIRKSTDLSVCCVGFSPNVVRGGRSGSLVRCPIWTKAYWAKSISLLGLAFCLAVDTDVQGDRLYFKVTSALLITEFYRINLCNTWPVILKSELCGTTQTLFSAPRLWREIAFVRVYIWPLCATVCLWFTPSRREQMCLFLQAKLLHVAVLWEVPALLKRKPLREIFMHSYRLLYLTRLKVFRTNA